MNLELELLLFIVFAGVQCLFYILFIKAFLGYKKVDQTTKEPVSVVVAAKNEMDNLPELLKQLSVQNHPNYEIIIVNDRSTDGTYDYLMETKKEYSNLKVVTVAHKPDQMDGKKYALTLGIKAAQYDNLVFTDGDCQLANENWLREFSFADGKQIILGVSLYKQSKGLLGSFIQFESLWTAIQYIGFSLLGMPYMGVGRNLGYKKELFLKSKGFNSIMSIVGGDDDLFVNQHANKGNTISVLGENTLTYTQPKTRWSSYFNQKLRHISVGSHYKTKHKIVLGLVSLSHLLYWALLIYNVVILSNPMLIAAAFILRTLFLYLAFILSSKKIGTAFRLWGLVFLDFVFVFYYLSIGTRALFTKKVRWI